MSDGISLLTTDDSVYVPIEFEPVVNIPALFAFSLIAVVSTLLFVRINSISSASEKRTELLEKLRVIKSKQLDNSMNVSDADIRTATDSYKNALEKELSLRSLIPGVRIAAPNDPRKNDEQISAAKQFLNMDLTFTETSSGTLENESRNGEVTVPTTDEQLMRRNLLTQSRRRMDGQLNNNKIPNSDDDISPMSNGSKAVLIVVAITQIILFWLLTLDPITASNFLSALDPVETISSVR
eukprot:CAMPEP_0197831612 /NCGR_PEP_ID=MMETSP1437-20131217/11313_1 /TAXON_ID=49252 ORGANISM="Eucampia antarctica, Strain CCMP1452" /NCGR_SAMPLE_ID=MMETSP1437 /ASSEMBLY_ACC=CAM_ASM_001096 /LENGTH=238 /DNA_ID=CAMNT_0043434611 /DNA_START=159 /DNA_END=875 /DNA_ORIENTATION=-